MWKVVWKPLNQLLYYLCHFLYVKEKKNILLLGRINIYTKVSVDTIFKSSKINNVISNTQYFYVSLLYVWVCMCISIYIDILAAFIPLRRCALRRVNYFCFIVTLKISPFHPLPVYLPFSLSLFFYPSLPLPSPPSPVASTARDI